jgi:glycerophosphoryl diester phosphodiesterase
MAPVHYNIEIKSTADEDNIFNPEPEVFTDLVVKVLEEKGITNRIDLQSFDIRPLQYLHRRYPEIKTALLISNIKSLKRNVKILGFTPTSYSPYHLLVSKKTVRQAHKRGILLIPWTVNKPEDMKRMKSLGVDGLITDYPNRYKKL